MGHLLAHSPPWVDGEIVPFGFHLAVYNRTHSEERVTASEQTKTAGPAAEPKGKAKAWKAGELARHTGLTRQSLQQYVLLGLLEPVDTTKGGQRLFTPDAVDRIKLIRDLCACGYTLRDIRDTFFKNRS